MHYYVVGVNGSGKTSLVKAISARTGITAVHGTAELMRYLSIPGDYDALRAMNQDEVLDKWAETAEHLVGEYGEKSFLLDTHLLNLTNGRVIRRDGPWIANYDALVLVKAKPAAIVQRILDDAGRDRAMFPATMGKDEKLHLLSQYQDHTEALFHQLATAYALPSLVIENDSRLEDGVEVFMDSGLY